MKASVSKIVILLLFSSLLLGCDKEYPAPEGTLKVIVDIPQEYKQNAVIKVKSIENVNITLYNVKVGNNKEIKVELNIGNYEVSLSSYKSDPATQDFFIKTQHVQIRQGQTTEITLREEP